jgi:hypothetical protein
MNLYEQKSYYFFSSKEYNNKSAKPLIKIERTSLKKTYALQTCGNTLPKELFAFVGKRNGHPYLVWIHYKKFTLFSCRSLASPASPKHKA